MARRRGPHRMTPARKAALAKAQKASARKRKTKHVAGVIGRGALQVGGAFATARVGSYIIKPSKARNDYYYIKGIIKKTPDHSPLPKSIKKAQMTWIP